MIGDQLREAVDVLLHILRDHVFLEENLSDGGRRGEREERKGAIGRPGPAKRRERESERIR